MSQSSVSSRRGFLKAATLTSAVFGAPASQLLASETRKAAENNGVPKRIIFMVSDGMNHGALSLAQHFLSRYRGHDSHWSRLYRELPAVRSLVETFSANSVVTDSAAASSAWGGGHRVNNGALNVAPDGREWAPIQTKLRQARIPTGLVSTATITHATPAGFAANTDNRGKEGDIARQYLERNVEVLLGGGRKIFDDDLIGKYKAAGYDFFSSRDELAAGKGSEAKPALGLFSPGYIPLAIDQESDEEVQKQIPPLADMARFAVQRLDAIAPDQWFLMVEGARIDHCGHANDAAGSIHEQIAFDAAIGAMLDYISTRNDTLLVITTDHGCGGIQLNGVSAKPDQAMAPGIYNGTSHAFDGIVPFRHSFEWMGARAGGLSGDPLREYIKAETGVELKDDELKRAQGLKSGEMASIFSKRHGIAWTSGGHTGDLVEFCAYGPGSHHFPAFIKNFEVHERLLRAFGLA